VRYKSGKPVDVVFACPCSSGLTCHGNGMFDVPLGEMGTYVVLYYVSFFNKNISILLTCHAKETLTQYIFYLRKWKALESMVCVGNVGSLRLFINGNERRHIPDTPSA